MKRILLPALLFALSSQLFGSSTSTEIAGRSAPDFSPDGIIVKYREGSFPVTARAAPGLPGGGQPGRKLRDNLRLVPVEPGRPVSEVLSDFRRDPAVEYAEPDYIRTVQVVPNDPEFSRQLSLAIIKAPSAWDINTGNRAVKIAVLDTGVDLNHPDLSPNIWDNRGLKTDFVDGDNCAMDVLGHGTKVAGIIAARGNDAYGITGVSWAGGLMPLRAGDSFGNFKVSDLVEAVDFAVEHGARIINASYCGQSFSRSEYDALLRAASAEVLVVAAAGNDGASLDCTPKYPACYDLPNVIAVAAAGETGKLTATSNYGAHSVHVAAPGERILTTAGARKVLFSATAEDGLPGWGLNRWDRSSSIALTPPFSLTNSLSAGRYPDGEQSQAVSPPLDLSGKYGCRLNFSLYGSAEAGRDFLYVEVSADSISWQAVPLLLDGKGVYSGITGTLSAWQPVVADISLLDGRASARFRFRFTADNSNTDLGYFIDNVTLTSAAGAAGYPSGSYVVQGGTSLAAAHVSGLAGLIWSQDPGLSAVQVKNIIMNSASRESTLVGYVCSGAVIDAYQALSNPDPESHIACGECGAGSGEAGAGGGGCFIATAAFGSSMQNEVLALRRFRDNYLAGSEAGRTFIKAYYRYSPPLAALIAKSRLLRTAVKAILFPLIVIAMSVDFGLPSVLFWLSAAMAILSCCFPRRGKSPQAASPGEK